MHKTFLLLVRKANLNHLLHPADRYHNFSKGTHFKKDSITKNILLSCIAIFSVLLLDGEVFV